MSNLEPLLEYGYIVAANDDYGVAIVWNGSATFNWYNLSLNTDDGYNNVDIMTVYGVESVEQASRLATEWIETEFSAEPDED